MRRCYLLLLSALLPGLMVACNQPEPEVPASAAKIFIVEEGSYEISGTDLEAAGLGWGDFDPARLQLLYRGQEEPLWVQRRGAELTVRFYGRASESKYSGANVYWLRLGAEPGQRMEEKGAAAGGKAQGEAAESYVATVRTEENRLYSPRVAQGEHWFWESLAAPAVRTFTVTLTALAYGAGRPSTSLRAGPSTSLRAGPSTSLRAGLRVEVWGSTEGPPSPDHHLRLSFNGQPLADEVWDGQGRRTIEAALPAALLFEGNNTVTLETPGDTGVAADIVFLDWIEVRYPRRFVAVADRLSFESDGGRHRLVGFSLTTADRRPPTADRRNDRRPPTADRSQVNGGLPLVVVFDVTRPEEVGLVASIEQERDGEGLAVTVWGEPGHRYLAVGSAGFLSPARIERATSDPDLRAPDNQADYLAIGHPDLMDALQPLLAWREEQGLRVLAVPVEAVYDQFNHGLPDPEAIRAFLQYATRSWQKPAPQYVLLVGDATYDPRGYLVAPGADPSSLTPSEPALSSAKRQGLVPTFLVPTVFGGETASDTAFARLDDDPWPDMAVGRLPARTPQQVRTVVEKILAYERRAAEGGWRRRVLMVADGQDGLFRAQSQALLAQLPPDFEVVESYPEPGALDAGGEVRQHMAEGSLLVNYIGHGSITQWGKDRLFTAADAAALSNGNRLPVVLNITCLTGLFTHPRVDSLAEELLWREGGGAVAVLAPTSLTLPTDQSFLSQALFEALFQDRVPTLGQAVLQAKRQTPADTAEARDVVETFLLFGDPALRLAYPVEKSK